MKKKKTSAEKELIPPITALSFKYSKVDMGTLLLMLLASTDVSGPSSIRFYLCNLSPREVEFLARVIDTESKLG